jgi:hypothetical protein
MSLGLSALWYAAVVLPDAQMTFHREWHRKDSKVSDPRRLLSLVSSLGYIASLPSALALRVVGRQGAGKIANSLVVLNAPTLLIAAVVVSEISAKLVGRVHGLFRALGRIGRKRGGSTR